MPVNKESLKVVVDEMYVIADKLEYAGFQRSKDLGKIVRESGRLFLDDPKKADEIFQTIYKNKEHYQKLSEFGDSVEDFRQANISPEGFKALWDFFAICIYESEKAGEALGLPGRFMYTLGIQLYFISLSLIDPDNTFEDIKKLYNIN